jgi:methylated-DNA-[protein]-cysteine S-methyltransferase
MLHPMLSIQIDRLKTPIGIMLIVTDCEANLRAVDWADCELRMHRLLQMHYGNDGIRIETSQLRSSASAALDQYFQGNLVAIDDLVVRTGGTVFQRDVWHALRSVPSGTTISYSDLAKQVGRPAAVRAVGAANGSNPVCIVVPCHRVIGSDGSLTGYAGGVERKRWLLRHELREVL